MSSWTDLNISDSLKAACADVRSKTQTDFDGFVKQALTKFGVSKVEDLQPSQARQLEEHIIQFWPGHKLVSEGKNSQGRTNLADDLDEEKRAASVEAAKEELADDHNHHNQIEAAPAGEGEKISIITKQNAAPVAGKVTKEPGVKTAAAQTLSPGERNKISEAAAKLGLKEACKNMKEDKLDGDQEKLDVDGDGDIEADDLKDLRDGKKPEKLEELSKDTLKSYAKKAAVAQGDHKYLAGYMHSQGEHTERSLSNKDAAKRRKGGEKAIDKLASRSDNDDLRHMSTTALKVKHAAATKADNHAQLSRIEAELDRRNKK